MGNTVDKQEEIIVEAAGSGTNTANQSAQAGINRTEWLMLILFAIVIICILCYGLKIVRRKLRKMIREEVHLHEVRKSTTNLA